MDVLDQLQDEILSMKRHVLAKREKPHKLILLLAVLEQIRKGLISKNEVKFESQLTDEFNRQFALFAGKEDWAQISLPFFHLRSSYFWNHKLIDGREREYEAIATPGGGSKRIIENIEFAYFDQDVWTLLQEESNRKAVIDMIMEILNSSKIQKGASSIQKLKTSFSESFRLSRSGLSQVLAVYVEAEEQRTSAPKESMLQSKTTLGDNQITSNANYVIGAGLVSRNGSVTDFGRCVYHNDPNLSRIETQWIIHYFFSSINNLGPLFWGKAISQLFAIGNALNKQVVAEFIQSISVESEEKTLKSGTYEAAATAMLGSYSAEDGLNRLELLEGPNKNQYSVQTPQPIPPAAFACILADYWQANFPNTASIDEEQLTQSDLPRLLLLGVDGFNAKLAELADPQRGLVQRQRRFNPPQLLRRWTDPAALWEALYA